MCSRISRTYFSPRIPTATKHTRSCSVQTSTPRRWRARPRFASGRVPDTVACPAAPCRVIWPAEANANEAHRRWRAWYPCVRAGDPGHMKHTTFSDHVCGKVHQKRMWLLRKRGQRHHRQQPLSARKLSIVFLPCVSVIVRFTFEALEARFVIWAASGHKTRARKILRFDQGKTRDRMTERITAAANKRFALPVD